MSLTAREKLLVHQVHPVKLGADITASVLSLVLIWRGHQGAGMGTHLALPVLAAYSPATTPAAAQCR